MISEHTADFNATQIIKNKYSDYGYHKRFHNKTIFVLFEPSLARKMISVSCFWLSPQAVGKQT